MDYIPHTPDDITRMMRAIGIASVEDLFEDIPEKYRLKRLLELPLKHGLINYSLKFLVLVSQKNVNVVSVLTSMVMIYKII